MTVTYGTVCMRTANKGFNVERRTTRNTQTHRQNELPRAGNHEPDHASAQQQPLSLDKCKMRGSGFAGCGGWPVSRDRGFRMRGWSVFARRSGPGEQKSTGKSTGCGRVLVCGVVARRRARRGLGQRPAGRRARGARRAPPPLTPSCPRWSTTWPRHRWCGQWGGPRRSGRTASCWRRGRGRGRR